MKSTQDLCIWLRELAESLAQKQSKNKIPYICLEVFSDKSFRINEHNGEVKCLYSSDEYDNQFDINDLAYLDADDFANDIVMNMSVADIKAEDL